MIPPWLTWLSRVQEGISDCLILTSQICSMGEEILFLTVEQVIELHDRLIARYSPAESRTILNHGMLDSAVMTPQQSFGGDCFYNTIEKIAAAYMAGLAANHAFENGNKRVA